MSCAGTSVRPMKKLAVLALVLLALGAAGYASSGQALLRGTVMGPDGQPLADCAIDRGLRVGLGFGGFDGVAYSTGADGRFALPVNRGVNRLTFECPGDRHGNVTAAVLRGFEPRADVALD